MLRSKLFAATASCWTVINLPIHASAQPTAATYQGSEEDYATPAPLMYSGCVANSSGTLPR